MRDLIKKILSESFINEKAAPRRYRPTPKEEEIEPEEDYNKTGWIYSINIDSNGKVNIIWKDDIRKLEKKYAEITKLENGIKAVDSAIDSVRRERRVAPGYITMLYRNKADYVKQLEDLKSQMETQLIDNPTINYFDI